ncbi:MAG: hypothetical protein U1F08_14110 [Steroidobacteraceae bacterium]
MRTTSAGSIGARVRSIFGARETLELAHAAAIRRRLRGLLEDDGAHPSFARLVEVVDTLRSRYGAEAVCAELPIAPSDYYAAKAHAADQRWRRLLAERAAHLSAGSSPERNSRPMGIRTLDPSSAVPTG